MLKALEQLPAAALVVLLLLAATGGWWLCRAWDTIIGDALDSIERGWYAFGRFLKRLVLAALVGCGLLFLIGVAYQSTH